MRPTQVPVGAVDGIDEDGRRLLDLDRPDRAVGDAVGEKALDRIDVALAGAHLLVGLVEEATVGLLVEAARNER